MRCIMCDEPDLMYIPSDDVDDYGLYSCGACDYEFEGPASRNPPAPAMSHNPHPRSRPIPIAVGGVTSLYVR